MFKFQFRILILLSALCSLGSVIHAQNCGNSSIQPDNRVPDQAYQKRKGAERCEGLIAKEVSGTMVFTVWSVTIGIIAYELNQDEVIQIKAPSTKKFKNFQIIGSSYHHPKNYRLDMAIQPGDQKSIPVGDVIASSEFKPNQLGFYIGISSEPDYFSPVMIKSKFHGKYIGDSLLVIRLINGITVRNVKVKYAQVTAEGFCGPVLGTIEHSKLYAKGKDIELKINLDKIYALPGQEHDICFSVNAKDGATDRDIPTYQFRVFITKVNAK